jgi:hypothetical protein
LLFGRLMKGGTVRVMMNAGADGLAFEFIEAPPRLLAKPKSKDDEPGDGAAEPNEPEVV